jgi:hypothetical protein
MKISDVLIREIVHFASNYVKKYLLNLFFTLRTIGSLSHIHNWCKYYANFNVSTT